MPRILWKDCLAQTDYDKIVIPHIEIVFYAYKDGVCTKHKTRDEALKVSRNVESSQVEESRSRFKEACALQRVELKKAMDIWQAAMMSEFSDLPVELFNLCYAEACERGHHAGQDDVYDYMRSVVDFANRVLETKAK